MKTLLRIGFVIVLASVFSGAAVAQEDGPSGLIAYILYTDTNGDGTAEPVGDNGTLWVLDTACVETPEGCVGANLTAEDTGDSSPAWAPDGESIVYVSREDRNEDGVIDNRDYANLYRITLADGTITRVTNSFTIDLAPSWAPDGTRMTFESLADTNGDAEVDFADTPAVHVINAGGGGRTLRTTGIYSRTPVWSTDGTVLAFVAFAEGVPEEIYHTSLFIISPDAGGRIQITGADTMDRMPAWAPDGRQLAFVATGDTDGDGVIDLLTDRSDLAVVNRDGGGLVTLAPCDGLTSSWVLDWAPDGSRIAYVYQGALYTVDAVEGGAPLQLTGEGFNVQAPAWAPDGEYIAFVSDGQLFVMSAAGGTTPVPLTNEGYVMEPAWAPLPPEAEAAPTPAEAEEGDETGDAETTPTPAGLLPAQTLPTPTPTPTAEGRG